MKKNSQAKAQVSAKSKSSRPRRRQNSQLSPSSQNPRWFASMEESHLPFGINLGGVKMGSGSGSTVGVAPRAIDVQRSTPQLRTKKRQDGNVIDVITGTDLIATVSSSVGGNLAGDLLVTQLISPTQFESTRLRQFSALYQRYRFKRIRFIYEPIANATQSGQLVGFADFDADNTLLTDEPQNVQTAVAHQGQRISQIWEPVVFDMAQVGSFTDLFTEPGNNNSDPRLAIQGVFYLIAASVLPSNIPLGNVYIDYEVEFSIPFLEPSSTTLNSGSVYMAAGTFTPTGSSPVEINIAPPVDILADSGPYTPRNSAGDFYWDSSFTGVPFVLGQHIRCFLTLEGDPAFTASAAAGGSFMSASITADVPGNASIVFGPTGTINPVCTTTVASAKWGKGCFTSILITGPVNNLSISYRSSSSSGEISAGVYRFCAYVTPAPLATQRSQLAATLLKSPKRQFNDIEAMVERILRLKGKSCVPSKLLLSPEGSEGSASPPPVKSSKGSPSRSKVVMREFTSDEYSD